MATFLQNLEVKMIVKEVEIQDAAKRKIDDMTRLRLGLPATGPVAFPAGAREATAAGMKSAVTGGGIGGLIGQITTLTTGIFSLAAIFMMAISNSKIIQVFMSTIGKALGLLVDVILMPFLPIFMIIMVGLFKGIMAFYQLWRDFWNTGGGKTIIDWMKSAISGNWGETRGESATVLLEASEDAKWWKNFITVGVKTILLDLFGHLDATLTWIWGLIFGVEEGAERNPGIINLAVQLLKIISPIEWLRSAFETGNFDKQFDLIANFKVGVGQWIVDLILGPQKFEPYYAKTPYELGQIGTTTETPWGGESGFASGGTVKGTGYAKVHKGETIVPAGKGGITVNITGQFKSDEDMYRKFVDRLRQEQWRTNV